MRRGGGGGREGEEKGGRERERERIRMCYLVIEICRKMGGTGDHGAMHNKLDLKANTTS